MIFNVGRTDKERRAAAIVDFVLIFLASLLFASYFKNGTVGWGIFFLAMAFKPDRR